MRAPSRPRVVADPSMRVRSLRGNREISRPAAGTPAVRIGKAGGPKPMTNGREKSDPVIVARKPANEGGGPPEEPAERRAGAKGNAGERGTHRTPGRASVSPGLDRVRQAARELKKERLTALLHHVDVALLRAAYGWLRREASAGVDGVTWQDYGEDLERRLTDLHDRVHRGAYRALPSRRVYIPKPDGRQRPLGIAALEDKIVQRAVAEVLNAIYEEDSSASATASGPGAASTTRWTRSRPGSRQGA
jgi:hypothetical protein